MHRTGIFARNRPIGRDANETFKRAVDFAKLGALLNIPWRNSKICIRRFCALVPSPRMQNFSLIGESCLYFWFYVWNRRWLQWIGIVGDGVWFKFVLLYKVHTYEWLLSIRIFFVLSELTFTEFIRHCNTDLVRGYACKHVEKRD